jgi:hypothetical protein
MSASTSMETPEKSPVVIPPLTSRTGEGELYTRHEAVETELLSLLPQGPPEWIKRRTGLKSESLVFLSRYIRKKDDYTAGRLQQEVNARTVRMAKRWVYGIYKEATEFIVSEVEGEINGLLLAEIPSRQSEYLEVGFGQTVYRHTKNAVERFKNTPLARKGEAVQESYDENGQGEIERPLEQVADGAAPPETEVLWKDWVEKALRFVTNPKHRETVILHFLRGWPIESKNPRQSCLTRHFKISARQIQTWIDTALQQMKDGIMGEGYGTAKSRF